MSAGRLQVQLVGPVRLVRDDVVLALPRSRKVLALLAYLAIEGSSQSRTRLCDLLFDGPNDPRGELRWCLSKLRALLDDDARARVVTTGHALVALDLSDALFDVREIQRVASAGLEAASAEHLAEASALFRGDLLEGIELDDSPELSTWLTARRHAMRALRVAIARAQASRPSADLEQARQRHEKWLELEPFEQDAHEALLELLLDNRQLRAADEHVARTIRAFERQGLDWAPLRTWWRESRARVPVAVTAGSEEVIERAPPTKHEAASPIPGRGGGRASVAIMPFAELAAAPAGIQLGQGLSDDVITRLAKLRALFVIARGTTYALGERGVDPREAGRILGVQYVVSGRIRRQGERLLVNVELAETSEGRIVWNDELGCSGEATFAALDAIVDRVVTTIAKEIESTECQRALLRPPSSLDAWQAYHRGLWHMYKFKSRDNHDAEQLFRRAIELDPSFARAHAGLSFTHFQNVFLELTPDRDSQIDHAFAAAAQSVATDDRDPAAHWAMGRALWLRGEQRGSIQELERSIDLSPNFALGHYTLGFVEAQSGDPRAAIVASNTSRELSPFDPLQFGMLASRALAHARLGELDEATDWAVAAIARPNAHVHILAIAACTLALARRADEARTLVARMRNLSSGYDIERFMRAFRFDRAAEQLLRQGARTIGF